MIRKMGDLTDLSNMELRDEMFEVCLQSENKRMVELTRMVYVGCRLYLLYVSSYLISSGEASYLFERYGLTASLYWNRK
jgi:hypothetical protein